MMTLRERQDFVQWCRQFGQYSHYRNLTCVVLTHDEHSDRERAWSVSVVRIGCAFVLARSGWNALETALDLLPKAELTKLASNPADHDVRRYPHVLAADAPYTPWLPPGPELIGRLFRGAEADRVTAEIDRNNGFD